MASKRRSALQTAPFARRDPGRGNRSWRKTSKAPIESGLQIRATHPPCPSALSSPADLVTRRCYFVNRRSRAQPNPARLSMWLSSDSKFRHPPQRVAARNSRESKETDQPWLGWRFRCAAPAERRCHPSVYKSPRYSSALRSMHPVALRRPAPDRKSTRLNSSHLGISYAVFCLKKKKKKT